MTNIEFIYFDLGRVLLDFTHERGFRQIAEMARISEAKVQETLVTQGLSDRYELGALTTAEFHRQFCESTSTDIDEATLCTAWGDIFDLMPQSVRLAAHLRAAGYRVGILSNTCEAHWKWAQTRFSILSALFHPVITSYDVKSMKPDGAIYQTAAERAGTPPERLFFMDDREENVTGAQSQGWSALQFQSALQAANELERLGLKFNR